MNVEDIDFNLVYEHLVKNGQFVDLYPIAAITHVNDTFKVSVHKSAKIVEIIKEMGAIFPTRNRRKLRKR